jgi:hypothetical protein
MPAGFPGKAAGSVKALKSEFAREEGNGVAGSFAFARPLASISPFVIPL